MLEVDISKLLVSGGSRFQLQLNMQIGSQELLAVYGPSGAGKTTLLRLLAGLERPDSGSIHLNGHSWYDGGKGLHLPVQQRRIGYVFQDYALFPNMTVRQNLQYAQQQRDDPIVEELLEMMALQPLASRHPETLSGGQRQRVALARALVRRPELLLMDEPLSALDPQMRRKLQDDILLLHRRFNTATVLVSHDLGEIFRLADRVILLQEGRIRKSGSVSDVFIGREYSGKFRFKAEVLHIEASDSIFIITLSIGNQLGKVVATPEEAASFKPGDEVIVSSKAFNPLLIPIKRR